MVKLDELLYSNSPNTSIVTVNIMPQLSLILAKSQTWLNLKAAVIGGPESFRLSLNALVRPTAGMQMRKWERDGRHRHHREGWARAVLVAYEILFRTVSNALPIDSSLPGSTRGVLPVPSLASSAS